CDLGECAVEPFAEVAPQSLQVLLGGARMALAHPRHVAVVDEFAERRTLCCAIEPEERFAPVRDVADNLGAALARFVRREFAHLAECHAPSARGLRVVAPHARWLHPQDESRLARVVDLVGFVSRLRVLGREQARADDELLSHDPESSLSTYKCKRSIPG